MRLLITVIGGLNAAGLVGYNKAVQSYVIRAPTINGKGYFEIYFEPVNGCEETFLMSSSDYTQDAVVNFASQTDIKSCVSSDENALHVNEESTPKMVEAYGISHRIICSPGSSKRRMEVKCMIGGVPFGSRNYAINGSDECERSHADADCARTFLAHRFFTSSIDGPNIPDFTDESLDVEGGEADPDIVANSDEIVDASDDIVSEETVDESIAAPEPVWDDEI